MTDQPPAPEQPATPADAPGPADWRAAFEERQAAKRALQASTAPCRCGHPKERHTRLKTGVYYQCRWYYGRGEGTCGCGLYRPRAVRAADTPDPYHTHRRNQMANTPPIDGQEPTLLRRMAAQAQQDGHVYLSTSCLHGEHGYCQSHTGLSGAKKPARCKFCEAPCVCDCHQTTGAQQRDGAQRDAEEDR